MIDCLCKHVFEQYKAEEAFTHMTRQHSPSRYDLKSYILCQLMLQQISILCLIVINSQSER